MAARRSSAAKYWSSLTPSERAVESARRNAKRLATMKRKKAPRDGVLNLITKLDEGKREREKMASAPPQVRIVQVIEVGFLRESGPVTAYYTLKGELLGEVATAPKPT